VSKEMTAVSNKEPLMHISKRDEIDMWKAWAIRLGAVLLSLVVCAGVIYALTGLNPLEVYKGIFDGAVGTKRRTWMTIRDTLVLLCIAIGITPAFKMRFWNIGAEGQVLIGGVTSAAMMIYLGNSLPPLVLFPLMLLGSALSAMVWAAIPAFFKAYWNTNETLFTLMMNYVARSSHTASFSGRIQRDPTPWEPSTPPQRGDGFRSCSAWSTAGTW